MSTTPLKKLPGLERTPLFVFETSNPLALYSASERRHRRPACAPSALNDFCHVAGQLVAKTKAVDYGQAGITTTNPHGGTYAGQINAPTGGNGSIEQVVTVPHMKGATRFG